MEPTFRFEISGREIFVFDNILTPGEVVEVSRYRERCPYVQRSYMPEPHTRTLVSTINRNQVRALRLFSEMRLFSEIEGLVPTLFIGEDLQGYDSYCNLIPHGDIMPPHRDCHPSHTDVTVLYYVNEEWKQAWGGETIFFNDHSDSVFAISPKPGRLAIFRGAIEYRLGTPLRDGYVPNMIIIYKFKALREVQ